MNPTDITRKGIINQGGFFSPYYLFDLLSRQHADELDPEGREANRRLLRKPFRAAWTRYGETGSTAGQAWTAWHRELFEALGFLGGSDGQEVPLHSLDAPVETTRHGLVPIARAAYLTVDHRPLTADESSGNTQYVARPPAGEAQLSDDQVPLVLVDLHGFGTNLDRDYYPEAGQATPQGHLTEESIARAVEFALDNNPTRWAIVAAGDKLRLYRKGGSVARQYLEVNFPALFDADRTDEWTAFWGLFRYDAFVLDPDTGKCLLDRVLEASQRHAARIADDLRENIVSAVEALIQGVLDDPANKWLRAQLLPSSAGGEGVGGGGQTLQQLFEESLYFLYRLLFLLYAESRDLLPVGESPVYRDTYSVEHLREMAERPLHAEDTDKTYYLETLRTLFKMLHQGFPPHPASDDPKSPNLPISPPFTIPPYNGQLFDPERTELLDRCRIPDHSMREVIRELSLSRPQRRRDRRERYSYADLGVDQLGSIYEGLLVYEPAIVTEETVVAKVKGEERLVSLAQAEAYDLPIIEGSQRRPGSFVLRLWGGRRKGSGSYYTPQEITSFLVKEALEPLVEPIVQGCAGRDSKGRPKRKPDDLLEIKVCDPAMGSGAFLIQACRYLAEAYGRAAIAAGLDDDSRMSQEEFARYKRRVAEKCLYGVDLNPLAVELAKVSLWLETLALDRPLTFLDAHLRCGNSLIGAPLRDENGHFTVERLSSVPDEALKEVSKEATREQKAAARHRIKRNREEQKRLAGQKAGQALLPGADWGLLSLREIEAALTETLTRRLDLETSDENLPLAQAVALIHQKEDEFDHLQHDADSPYHQAKQICDLWCAVWFWPEPGTEVTLNRDGQQTTVIIPEPPTSQVFLELVGGILGTDPGSLTDVERTACLTTAEYVAQQQRFFHWELEFPEVWREKNGRTKKNGGFDAVVGNPPWEIVKPNSQEFWSNYDPLFRELNKQQAIRFADKMRANPNIESVWLDYERYITQTGQYLKQSMQYLHQGRGDINTYKLFLERSHFLLREAGGLGMVLPSGLYNDLGAKDLRQLLFNKCQTRYLLVLANERFIFPAIHHAFRFVLLILQRGGRTEKMHALFRLNVRNAIAPEELSSLFTNPASESLSLELKDIRRFSPDTFSLLEFRNQREADITAQIYEKYPVLGEEDPVLWNLRFSSDFHMTSHSYLFRDRDWLEAQGFIEEPNRTWLEKGGSVYLPLYEGKMIHQYNHEFEEPRFWVSTGDGSEILGNKWQNFRCAFRDVAANTNERSLIVAVVPLTFCGNTLPTIGPSDIDNDVQLFVLSLFNSLTLDFLIRMKVSMHMNFHFLFGLPIPRLTLGNPHFDAFVPRAAQLTCNTAEFANLWNEVSQHYQDELPAPWQPEYAATDPQERAQLRAEIDALVVDLYGLSEQGFAYILTTFPLLDRDMPPLPGEPKSFITRDLALLELFKLRGKTPPADVVEFFAEAGADISGITGPIRDLAERVEEATRLGAVAYVPSGRGGGGND